MLKGRAHVYGDNLNTDLIIAGKYTKTLNMRDLAQHCLEDIDRDFITRVRPGDVIAGGENFGCGSSREQAPLALKHAGICAVLAKSCSRLFFRNAINLGFPVVICDTGNIKNGDLIEISPSAGLVIVNGIMKLSYQGLPEIMQKILTKGGLVAYMQEYGDFL